MIWGQDRFAVNVMAISAKVPSLPLVMRFSISNGKRRLSAACYATSQFINFRNGDVYT